MLKNSIKKWIIPFVSLYIGLMVVFTAIILLVQFIPLKYIESNIQSSTVDLLEEGIYPRYGFSSFHCLDTQTDALTFNMLYIADNFSTVDAAMINNVYQNDTIVSQADMLNDVIHGNVSDYDLYSYSRNWHGYQLFIKPLLVFTDFTGIKIVNAVFMLLILFLLCYLLWKKICPAYSICFMLVFTAMNLFIMPLCMQYCTCINIAILGMITMLLYPNCIISTRNACLTFFTIGTLCNYFDWFTIPQVTFGLPFIVYYTIQGKHNPIKSMLIVGSAWLVGYSVTLVSKWAIGTMITDYNCFDLALSAVKKRMSTDSEGVEYDLVYALKSIAYVLVYYGLGAIVLFANIYSFVRFKERWLKTLKDYYWLLVVACIVPVWYLIIRNHSFLHFSLFAWRALVVTFYAVLIFSYFSVYKILNHKSV